MVVDDDRGHYELTGEEAERVKEIHERLEHLTSEKLVKKYNFLIYNYTWDTLHVQSIFCMEYS